MRKKEVQQEQEEEEKKVDWRKSGDSERGSASGQMRDGAQREREVLDGIRMGAGALSSSLISTKVQKSAKIHAEAKIEIL